MRLITLFFLSSLTLFANFFPQSTQTTIKTLSSNTLSLETPFSQNGMSGIVIHNYGNNIQAITAKLVQQTASKALLIESLIAPHKRLPTINTSVKIGDKVIGGYLYNTVLLLAPNAQTYANITTQYQKKWIHPDLFALYLGIEGEAIPTPKSLKSFAQKYQIGLIYIVRKNDEILFDPISSKIVAKKASTSLEETQFPFYMRFKELDNSWFFKNKKGDYYETMETI